MKFHKFIILFLFFIISLSFPSTPCVAIDIELAWDPNLEEDLAGYRIFTRKDGESYNYENPAWEGAKEHTTCIIVGLDGELKWFFVARAFDTSGNESGDSNEVLYTPTLELGMFSELTASDLDGTPLTGILFMGYSGREISFSWIPVVNAEEYEFRLKLVQTGRLFAIGYTSMTNTSVVIPKTGIFVFEIRAGWKIGTSGEEWTEWISSGDPTYTKKDGSPASLRFSGWPAPPTEPIIE